MLWMRKRMHYFQLIFYEIMNMKWEIYIININLMHTMFPLLLCERLCSSIYWVKLPYYDLWFMYTHVTISKCRWMNDLPNYHWYFIFMHYIFHISIKLFLYISHNIYMHINPWLFNLILCAQDHDLKNNISWPIMKVFNTKIKYIYT